MSSVLREDYYCTLLSEDEKDENDELLSDCCINEFGKLWKNGSVPFFFNDNVNEELKDSAKKAMENISVKSAIEFLEITKSTKGTNYIEIIKGLEFLSNVGMQHNGNKLWVAEGSAYPVGQIMHELMHALGFYHEHSRPDRDEYLDVNNEAAKIANYKKRSESNSVCYSNTLDFHSIMIYRENEKMTLKEGINFKIGQRIKLSDGDINALNNLYPPKVTLLSRIQALDNDILIVKERLSNLPVNNNNEERLRLKKEHRELLV
ncbi:peptidase family M12A-domain-containing protein [Rhizophagus irregularis DAOM 181602=DAOM 197198]|uniref:Metalloendopeptidase n=1 Tax=Rhizophagus irregularis (strain DAOM 181602 / DAOM 197198 / MUCL 43194) TaxID=747089 RepID=A0A2P4QRR6_RHIID|nr:peptidase family M12A-domain-containing protein [Rhizophagus irregularis DAOM 181602=DAOM 197198]POG80341.1 peptidase family M12A-domain-containing protein [Rhizophagus irregularis DAOM 181602=DAOM 197198]|eukprot:XP_025187207.1 peptidase family M12A-domain-containing protein [Rhizophagus irregularis DAOM 181602=DAOM 197198]